MSLDLFAPLDLPNGESIPNRIAKAAMEENMAVEGQLPGRALWNLYSAWAKGGAGLIITGNVMVDGRAMTGPGGVVLEAGTVIAPFKRWARAIRAGGAQAWMQLSHPGRQVYAGMGGNVWSASDIPLDLGKHSKMFGRPVAMSEEQIEETIGRFATSAALAEEAGFTGVQIHAAHGYLISQFLSPLSNRREDKWGGSVENRARFLREIIRAVRESVSPAFCVAVKLNSADFQRGGFDEKDATRVVEMLNILKVDLVELSGGSYESPAMQGRTADGRTLAREAYFLDFAQRIASAARMPVMTTGGINRKAVAQHVLDQGIDMVGIATALAMNPHLVNDWKTDPGARVDPVMVPWKDKALVALGTMAIVKRQLRRLGVGKQPMPDVSPTITLLMDQLRKLQQTRRYRRWLKRR
ncbi:MAG: NADH:flavin oxidoreductase/NADH oxidase family protein [Chromatiales bacterium]|nr:NADH:flavin oxidoreductase/NADH oxidase family protein [Chromatiales bacterium]